MLTGFRQFIVAIGTAGLVCAAAAATPVDPLPERLSEAGLYMPGTRIVRPAYMSFTPQYPLWSDGAAKRRWLYLPPGTAIDASNAYAWEFPRGTRLWKEFSHGRAIETRLIERLDDGSWRYAAYVWAADGTDALLAPAEGIPNLVTAAAPGGVYTIPSQDDCRACHEGPAVPILGVSALQLSPDRDPHIPRVDETGPADIDLNDLAARGLIINLPPQLLVEPPGIDAVSPSERTALGYLHANCGHCHNADGPLGLLEMVLAQESAAGAAVVRDSLVDKPSEFEIGGFDRRIVAGEPDASVLLLRMRSRDVLAQMPPLGTRFADGAGIELIEHWILNDLPVQKEHNQ